MALVVADRVQETTTTTGTGTITLAGAVSGFQSFATIGNGNTTYYCVTSGTAWEVGIGTYTSAGTTLARTTILASSAAAAAITLAGTSNVFCVYPAGKSVYLDSSGNVTGYLISGGSLNNTPIGATTASTGAFTTLSASSTVSGTGFSTYLASPPAIGGTAAAAGTFTTVTGRLTPSAGTATAGTAPLKFTSGTNLTTAEAGAMEYDGKVSYFSGEASQRGVVAASQFVILTSDYTTPLGTSNVLKQAFNATTNGTLTLTTGSYLFECLLNLSSLSATSGTIAFGFGGTALGRFRYLATANKTATSTTAANTTFSNTAAATIITPATTTTTGYALVQGSIVITTAGTLIPSIALSVAAANVVATGSYFNLTPIGSSTATTVGNWS